MYKLIGHPAAATVCWSATLWFRVLRVWVHAGLVLLALWRSWGLWNHPSFLLKVKCRYNHNTPKSYTKLSGFWREGVGGKYNLMKRLCHHSAKSNIVPFTFTLWIALAPVFPPGIWLLCLSCLVKLTRIWVTWIWKTTKCSVPLRGLRKWSCFLH